MARFDVIRLGTPSSGVRCVRSLLAHGCAMCCFLGTEGAKRSAAVLGAKVRFYAASLLPNTRVAITTTRATAMPPISEGQGEPVKPATRYPNKQMTATREA